MNDYQMLKDKNILVGVTGSVAIYKTCELIRLYVKAGANVKVVMSDEAKKFITPLMFESLSRSVVLHSATESWADECNHIGFAKWADVMVVAPATANTIAKLANGIADNLLLQTALACAAPIIVAPAANTVMINAPATRKNLATLHGLGYDIAQTESKELACGDVGDGAMAGINDIFWLTAKALLCDKFWCEREVLITGGGTKESIDAARVISNRSSGKMAQSLSLAAYVLGADVRLIYANEAPDIPKGIQLIKADSSKSMKEEVEKELKNAKKSFKKAPYLLMAAAVSDYAPTVQTKQKLKKEALGKSWQLELVQTEDILQGLDKSGVVTIGFKAETSWSEGRQNAKKALLQKNIDAICLNVTSGETAFGSDKNEIELISKNGTHKIELADKLSVSLQILQLSKSLECKSPAPPSVKS